MIGPGEANVMYMNPAGTSFIDGDAVTEGSHRFSIDTDTGDIIAQVLISDIWQPAPIMTGSNTIKLKYVGLGAIGEHIVTELGTMDKHFHAHNHYNGTITDGDARIVDVYEFVPRDIFQPDNTGVFSGKIFSFIAPIDESVFVEKFHLETDAIVPTSPVTIKTWRGTVEGAPKDVYFKQVYPPSEFPALSEIILLADGFVQFDKDDNYFVKIECDSDFSLKTNAAVSLPWLATDDANFREDDMLQIRSYDSRADGVYSFTDGEDWAIYQRKIYVCNTTGTQTGTFASNIAKWDALGAGGGGGGFWGRSGTTLSPVNAGDVIATTGRLNIGSGTLDTEKVLIQDDTVNSTTLLKVANADTGNSSANVQVMSDGCGVNLRAFGTGYIGTPDEVWLDAFNNSGGLVIKSGAGIELRTSINTTSMTVTSISYQVGNSTDNISQNNNSFNLKSIGKSRFVVDSGNSRLYPPDMQGHLKLPNGSMIYNDGTTNRFSVDSSGIDMTSPDNNTNIHLENDQIVIASGISGSELTVYPTSYQFALAGTGRFAIDSTYTRFISPDGTNIIKVDNTGLDYNDGTRDRVLIDSSKIELVSPDGSKKITLTNSGGLVASGPITAEDKYYYIGDANTDGSWRMRVNGSYLDFDLRAGGVYNMAGRFGA